MRKVAPRVLLAIVLAAAGCRDDGGAGGRSWRVGPITELPLLEPRDPARPFEESSEPSVAARDGRVVISMSQFSVVDDGFASRTNYDDRVIAAVRSEDGGETYAPPVDPMGEGADYGGNAVVRVGADGTYWLALLIMRGPAATTGSLAGRVLRSTDGGGSWELVRDLESMQDKPWLAIRDTPATVYVTGWGGNWQLDAAGTTVAATDSGEPYCGGAYADETGMHTVSFGTDYWIFHWEAGMDGQVVEGGPVRAGEVGGYDASCLGFGRTGNGRQWLVRAVGAPPDPSAVVLHVRSPGDAEGTDVAVSSPEQSAFFPAGALDADGFLHVAWYDSAGATGVLRYARSLTAQLTDGFTPSIVVDDDACPGEGWRPSSDVGNDLRRLRDYIDVATDGRRAHLAWTHAPRPPARAYATWVEWD
jgi:hypothetical protein